MSVCGSLAIFAVPASAQLKTEFIRGHEVVANEVLVNSRVGASSPGFLSALRAHQIDKVQSVDRNGWLLLHSSGLSASALETGLKASSAFDAVEPNYVVHANLIPNDPYWPNLYGMRIISGPDAWDLSTGSTANVVVVIDTGVTYNHPDLVDNIWSAPTDFSVVIGDVTLNCPAGTHGYNAILDTCDPLDDHGHGTHTSGTVGAIGNNGIGVVGVNWTASVMSAKFLDHTGSGTTAGAIKSIEFTIQMKAYFGADANVRVLSNSWGGGGFSAALRDEIASARDNDMMFVAAAGNNNSDNDQVPFYPASYDVENVVAVASTTATDARSGFSNWGANSVHLGAPGSSIWSTVPTGYGSASGTSMATPHVAGAAALVLSYCSMDTPTLKQALLNNVDPIAALQGITITGGRLNVFAAMLDPSCIPGQ
jgi:subtilisin family serine protease